MIKLNDEDIEKINALLPDEVFEKDEMQLLCVESDDCGGCYFGGKKCNGMVKCVHAGYVVKYLYRPRVCTRLIEKFRALKMGDVIEMEGEHIAVVKGNGECRGCIFDVDNKLECRDWLCDASNRPDNRHVKFVKVDMGD